ncbi:MAG: hypothetical protein FWG15_08810 [Propionibacteriaceae bacterium]|nr:hypothetical protein [Propionibacteriaceae bacterium]
MGVLVDPDAIAYVNPVQGLPVVSVDGVRQAAGSLVGLASSLRESGAEVVSHWAPISSSYHGPGDEVVWSAMIPVGQTMDQFAANVEVVGGALSGFADDIEPIVASLQLLKTLAQSLVDRVNSFEPSLRFRGNLFAPSGVTPTVVESWAQDEELNTENNQIIKAVNVQVALFHRAERDCAARILALSGGGVDYQEYGHIRDSNTEYYGFGNTTLDQMDMGWGFASRREESCHEQTVMFVPNLRLTPQSGQLSCLDARRCGELLFVL